MAEYDRFAGILRNIIKRGRAGDDLSLSKALENAFVSSTSWLPKTFVYDVFNYFLTGYGTPSDVDGIQSAGEKLLELLHLLEMDYEREIETFNDDDWRFIGESISDCAVDLDQELLTYVMKKIVSKGLIG
ncbi:MAG: hypothetical protein CMN78_03900 [Spirochaetales bacterium]|nr:hypothetical protein [Spirochaetales bacterium]